MSFRFLFQFEQKGGRSLFKLIIFFHYEFCLLKLLPIIVVAKVASEAFVQQVV
jgi:hypothetical protein